MIVDEWVNMIRPGTYGPYTHGPFRMVGHCTDSPWGAIGFTTTAPKPHYHVVVDVRPSGGRPRASYQLCRLDQRCGGLKQPALSTGIYTNRRSALQWSVVGPAQQMHTLTEEECRWIGTQIAPMLKFAPSVTGDHPVSIGPGDHSGAIATASWSGRHTLQEWNEFHGWTQHQRVIANDHYDIYVHEWQFGTIIASAYETAFGTPQETSMILDVGSVPLAATPGAEGIASITNVAGGGARVLAVDGGVFDIGVPAVGNAFNYLSSRRATHYASGFKDMATTGYRIVIRRYSDDAIHDILPFGTPMVETVDKDTLVNQFIDGPSATWREGWKKVIA